MNRLSLLDEDGKVHEDAENLFYSMLRSFLNVAKSEEERLRLSQTIGKAAQRFHLSTLLDPVKDILYRKFPDGRLDELIGSISLEEHNISAPRCRDLLEFKLHGAATENCKAWSFSLREDPEDSEHDIYFNSSEMCLNCSTYMLEAALEIGLPGLTAKDMNILLVTIWHGLGGYERRYSITLD